MPFKWQRLQPQLLGELSSPALTGLDAICDLARQHGAVVVLDAHDYGRRDGAIIGDPASPVTIAAFADFWGKMAARFGQSPDIWFNLMNEPYNIAPDVNVAAQNAACTAIRHNGGKGMVLFSGIAWTGAHSWVSSGNAKSMLAATDPLQHCAFDMHQYLDAHFGGSSPVAIPGVGSFALRAATDWARVNRKLIFLGEFATGPTIQSLKELHDLLEFIAENRDVFIGATYFGAGGVWGKANLTSTDPVAKEKPQTTLLRQMLVRFNAQESGRSRHRSSGR